MCSRMRITSFIMICLQRCIPNGAHLAERLCVGMWHPYG